MKWPFAGDFALFDRLVGFELEMGHRGALVAAHTKKYTAVECKKTGFLDLR